MNAERWAAAHLPDLTGRTMVVTGATSGIGLHAARHLARAGARTVLACRDTGRASSVAERIAAEAPVAPVVVELDLSDQHSTRQAADVIVDRVGTVDVLVANAGVMAIPLEYTVDGHERQLATNHLGHFTLAALLMPALLAADAPRVVIVTSFLARSARIRLDDLDAHDSYDPWAAYGQSKLANLLMATELASRASAVGSPLVSVAAHPGYAATSLVANGPGPSSTTGDRVVLGLGGRLVAQSAAAGALPIVAAATDRRAGGGTLVAPGGPLHLRGKPRILRPPRVARQAGLGAALWEASERLTGTTFDLA